MLNTDSKNLLYIEFKFGKLSHGKIMQVEILHNNQVYCVSDQKNCFSLPVSLPGTVTLAFSCKDMMHDTVTDSHGNVVEDLYVKIQKIKLDGFDMSVKFLNQKLVLITDDGKEIPTAYIGFNGKIVIDLNYSSVFEQIMYWKR
jgi:hypothetical protein